MSIVGMDVGTTGTKAVAFDLDGRVVARAYREYPTLEPRPGWLELDPRQVLGCVKEVLSKVSADVAGDPVQAIALSVLGETAAPLDADREPLHNAIIGFDPRGGEFLDEFASRISSERVFSIAGHPINHYHTLFKLLWLRRFKPDVFKRMDLCPCFCDYVCGKLGAGYAIEHSTAARTLMLDIHKRTWSDEILGAADLDPALLSRPVAPGEIIGEVSAAGEQFGLRKGTKVVAGLHDQPAGIFGAGVEPGESMLATGTVVCLGVRLAEKPSNESVLAANNLCYYPTYGRDEYISLAWNFTGGSLLRWYRDTLGGVEVADARAAERDPYDLILAELPEDPTDLIALPHFTTTGTPHIDAEARGAVLGLRTGTSKKQLVKALIEGIAYEVRLNVELLDEAGIRIDRFKAIGGAAKSDVWMQIYADVLGKPVLRLGLEEGTSLGVAMLAGHAAGLIDDMDATRAPFVRASRAFEPDPARKARYDERFGIYRDLYPATKDLSHRIARLG